MAGAPTYSWNFFWDLISNKSSPDIVLDIMLCCAAYPPLMNDLVRLIPGAVQAGQKKESSEKEVASDMCNDDSK